MLRSGASSENSSNSLTQLRIYKATALRLAVFVADQSHMGPEQQVRITPRLVNKVQQLDGKVADALLHLQLSCTSPTASMVSRSVCSSTSSARFPTKRCGRLTNWQGSKARKQPLLCWVRSGRIPSPGLPRLPDRRWASRSADFQRPSAKVRLLKTLLHQKRSSSTVEQVGRHRPCMPLDRP